MAVIFDYILGKLRLADAVGTPATTTTPGVVVIATPVEAAAGTDPDKVVTPATLATELAKKQDSLGISAEGDAAKFLNQQGAWAVPATAATMGAVEIISNPSLLFGATDTVGGRVAVYTGPDNLVYYENHWYRNIAVDAYVAWVDIVGGSLATAIVSGAYIRHAFTANQQYTHANGEWASTIRFSDGYWYIHTWKWTDDTAHQDEYRAEGTVADWPWSLTWESSWGEGAGVGGTLPALTVGGSKITAWFDITPYGAMNDPWAS